MVFCLIEAKASTRMASIIDNEGGDIKHLISINYYHNQIKAYKRRTNY